jgi:anti-sigma regulatory factor (Ser/Thr protein kinase)
VAASALAADEAELAAGELFANAVRHSLSGRAGGKVTVLVAWVGGEVAVHVHDLGPDDNQSPHPGLALVPSGDTTDLPVPGGDGDRGGDQRVVGDVPGGLVPVRGGG